MYGRGHACTFLPYPRENFMSQHVGLEAVVISASTRATGMYVASEAIARNEPLYYTSTTYRYLTGTTNSVQAFVTLKGSAGARH